MRQKALETRKNANVKSTVDTTPAIFQSARAVIPEWAYVQPDPYELPEKSIVWAHRLDHESPEPETWRLLEAKLTATEPKAAARQWARMVTNTAPPTRSELEAKIDKLADDMVAVRRRLQELERYCNSLPRPT